MPDRVKTAVETFRGNNFFMRELPSTYSDRMSGVTWNIPGLCLLSWCIHYTLTYTTFQIRSGWDDKGMAS